ncbi:Rpn family recombination-promoting nuclease/putative transposase [Proteus terrae subsp. cibarius]|uniref:Rpn family recombination-promoting nuclease/putative transposase n=1 Tax=Proteus terrae subsp. cibarius TaxID=626774 RepID=A0ABX6JSI2_9GAMM|nr:Rpn family recombination-promoting nuclease/putative transposase [Proteus terrae]QGW04773.1 Rpn family recombination-promoting nuclease/putative transposase [Proteus terrae subsp. cibarius]QIF91822.1 Rpn family recombination-promoting nuclease/putative transposase [Proteus terrae subsp. cibarius]
MKKSISISSYDSAFKRFMMNVSNAKDFFFVHLPEDLKSHCDFSTLQLQNSAFIDINLRSRMSDILYLVKTKEGDISIYLLIEHQSKPDKMIAWRMMNYAFYTMNQHLQQGYKSLPLVVPILFYHGEKKPYPFPVNWMSCFPLNSLANKLYSNSFSLIDLTSIDDDILLTHKKAAVMEIAMKYVNSCHDINEIAILLSKAINQKNCRDEDTIAVVEYLFSIMDASDFEFILNKIVEQVDNHKEVIMNIAWRLENKGFNLGVSEGFEIGKNEGIELGKNVGIELGKNVGIEIGKAKGIELGKTEGIEIGKAKGIELGKTEGIEIGKKIVQMELAQNLLKENFDLLFIEKISGLSIQEIEELTV